jgi:small glutamine-rich tetratricopeptide repeat-containing protein alpha
MNNGSGPGQQPPQHSVNINLNDFFGHANINGNGQGPTTGSPDNHVPPFPFPANDGAVPPAFPLMGSGADANHAQQASGDHGGPGTQTDAGVYVNIAGQEQAAEALRAVMQMFGPQMGGSNEGAPPRGLLSLSVASLHRFLHLGHT